MELHDSKLWFQEIRQRLNCKVQKYIDFFQIDVTSEPEPHGSYAKARSRNQSQRHEPLESEFEPEPDPGFWNPGIGAATLLWTAEVSRNEIQVIVELEPKSGHSGS
ncbi:unnamed protein product [Toxocara canis]|uniref:Uncharacterized protein n=1 Tax=Toxocara canis TaxID=6265 RepID=A0A183UIE1_TOXCA|nr:unnamed protein product [Toxocara canis]